MRRITRIAAVALALASAHAQAGQCGMSGYVGADCVVEIADVYVQVEDSEPLVFDMYHMDDGGACSTTVRVTGALGVSRGSTGTDTDWSWLDVELGDFQDVQFLDPPPPPQFQTSVHVTANAFANGPIILGGLGVTADWDESQGGMCPTRMVRVIEKCSAATVEIVGAPPLQLVPPTIEDEDASAILEFDVVIADSVPAEGCLVEWVVQDRTEAARHAGLQSGSLPWLGQVLIGPTVPDDAASGGRARVTTDVRVESRFLKYGRLNVNAFVTRSTEEGVIRKTQPHNMGPGVTWNAVLNRCTCTLGTALPPMVMIGVDGAATYPLTIVNDSTNRCDYTVTLQQVGNAETGLPLPFDSGPIPFAPKEAKRVDPSLTIHVPAAAREDFTTLKLAVTAWDGRTCEWDADDPDRQFVREEPICVLPEGEHITFLNEEEEQGWRCRPNLNGIGCLPGHEGTTIGMFGGTLQPTGIDFRRRSVKEELSEAVDGCRAAYKANNGGNPPPVPACGTVGFGEGKPATWTVGADNQWQPDNVGYPSGCVDFYRARGYGSGVDVGGGLNAQGRPVVCTAKVRQQLGMSCFGQATAFLQSWERYVADGELRYVFDERTIRVIRSSGSADTTGIDIQDKSKVYP